MGIALNQYDSKLFGILDRDRKKQLITYDTYFSRVYQSGKDDLDPIVASQIEVETRKLLTTLEFLYLNGADVNHHTYLAYKSQGSLQDVFCEKKELREGPTVFEKMVTSVLMHSKDISILQWITSKEDFDVNKLKNRNIGKGLLHARSPESVKVLQMILEMGLPIEEMYMLGIKYSVLVDCIVHEDIKYRQEKFNLLWKYATEEQRGELIENFDVGSIKIPVELEKDNVESSVGTSKNR